MKQVEYIAILFADCGYDTASQRKGWLQKRFGKDFADELDSQQRSIAITELKDEKASKSPWTPENSWNRDKGHYR
jgi:hypothetical protein